MELIYKILKDKPLYENYLNDEFEFCFCMDTIKENEKSYILDLLRYGLYMNYCCIDGMEFIFLFNPELREA